MSLAYRLRASHLASLLLLGSSCSVLYDLSPDQCERSSDCASFGTGYVCDAGLCKPTDDGSGGASSGGAGNSGGRGGTNSGGGTPGTGGKSASGGMTGDAGGGMTGDAGGGVGGEGGSGGVPPPECTQTAECDAIYGVSDPHTCVDGKCEPVPPECATHADCIAKYGEPEPLVCVRGQCQPLLTDECPVVLPRLTGSDDIYSLLKSSNAVILGAFSFISGASLDGITVRNYDLVLRDFFTKANGVVLDGQRRNVVMVVCSSNGVDSTQILNAGRHLAYDLDVSAILSALPADDTQRLFETFRSERGKNVFFLMPNYTDETLINLEDDNLIWHMLSGADSLAAAYTPLLERTETHLRNGGQLGATEDMRVALITATDERFLDDLGTSVRANIRFNGGKTAAQNSPASFVAEGTTSYTTDTAHTFDHAPMVSRVLALAPHVIIGATSDEMADKIIPLIESKWATEVGTQPKPFYLVSPFLYNNPFLSRLDSTPSVRLRMAGVNWASAEDRTIYNAYMDRYQLTFAGVRDEGYENWYDAAYYLVYALAGGRTAEATAVAVGFKRLLAGTPYEVGQADMPAVLTQLGKLNGDLRLIGANGPPNWNTTTGGRNDAGSVWCINASGALFPDVLRYQPGQSGASATLTGTFPCFQFPKPPP